MFKKLILVFALIISVLLSGCSVGNTHEVILKIDTIQYDTNSKCYVLTGIDENEEMWALELDNDEYKTVDRQNGWILATFDDMNTSDLYDDEIVNWSNLF
jgi:hypothetical protein